MKYTETQKRQIFSKGAPVRGKDPLKNRKDTCGNEMFYDSYGQDTPMGWEIDHKKPKSKGGSDKLPNLQPLKTSENRRKSDKYPHICSNIKPLNTASTKSKSSASSVGKVLLGVGFIALLTKFVTS